MEQLVGHTFNNEKEIEQTARQILYQYGIELVVVSMGEKGAIFVNKQTSLFASPPAVTVKSTVGAGDAMVAGLVVAQSQGLNLFDQAHLATAFSTYAVSHIGLDLPSIDGLQKIIAQISVQELER